ncbi:MAG: Holliday junction branch migration protein RuvA [Acutalibacteraceae bacterium]|nr:Holliday junction branch migration protein RuvA [Acutalibacteraceae bacterium]
MIYSLTGEIIAVDQNGFAIQTGGVAFFCFSTMNTLQKVGMKGSRATVFTYMNVREDAIELYGFYTSNELDAFKQLITVSGVGPKAALAILSVMTPDQLALNIASGDAKAITKAQGVGTKIAQRIVLELKNKFSTDLTQEQTDIVAAIQSADTSADLSEAIEALIQLGYSRSEAAAAVSKLDKSLSVEEMIRLALKSLI